MKQQESAGRRLMLNVRRWAADLHVEDLPQSEADWLRALGGPTVIRVPGRDARRTRVATTLLHGNEPSGLRAMHRWLRDDPTPSTDALLVVACVDTALCDPLFAHRHLPDRRDFNRCFRPPFDDAEGRLAQQLIAMIREAEPECLVDLHNNTGHNPAYGVAPRLSRAELGLVSLFADRVVHAPLTLGTLVEASVATCPSVTIECGRSGDPYADDVAYEGLARFLERDALPLSGPEHPIAVLDEPIRVCVVEGVDLAFDDAAHPEVPLTISSGIDRHNFERLPAGAAIGWVRAGADWPLDARRPDGSECSRELFEIRGERLATSRDLVPIMMTTRPDIAKSDCLFYAVRQVGVEEA